MALGGNDYSSFDLNECQVCMAQMAGRNPRMLACHHSFCQHCLVQLLQEGQISCPTCHEVTKPDDGEITNLPMNFNLLKNWERESQPETAKDISTCGLCKTKPANVQCKDCKKLLCGQCDVKHNTVPGNEEHLTYNLCKKHGDSIGHVCIQCIELVCITCIVQEHENHKDHLLEFDHGVNTIKQKLTMLIKTAEYCTECLIKSSEKVKSRINENVRNKKQLENKRQFNRQELEKLNKMEESLSAKQDQDQEIFNALTETRDIWRNYHPQLIALRKEKNPDSLVKGFKILKNKVKGTFRKINNVLALAGDLALCPEMDFSLELNRNRSRVDYPSQPLCKFEKLENILDVLLISGTLQWPVDITVMPSGNLCVADHDLKMVAEFDQTGTVVQSHHPVGRKEGVRGVCFYNDSLYILQPSAIIKLVIGKPYISSAQEFKPGANNMGKFLVADEATIIISDYGAGKVYRYNLQADITSLLLQGLDGPTFISMATTERGVRYAVTEQRMDRVNVYNDEWTLVTSVGGLGSSDGKFQCPMSTLMTPSGELLVADWGNQRISMFSCDGSFQRHLLGEKTNIQYPVGLAYKHPLLWIMEFRLNYKAIKCYFVK